MISVRPALTRDEVRAFHRVPFELYAREVMWTPPLLDDFERTLSNENPLWAAGRGERALFVAWNGKRAVGRIVAHVHHASNERHSERVGLFGFLDCENNVEISNALLDAAASWHRTRGVTVQRGPFELTITQCVGAIVDGYEEPASFSQSWSPPHLPALLTAAGFEAKYRFATFKLDDLLACQPDTWLADKQRAWLDDSSVVVRSWDMAKFEHDLDAAVQLLNESFAGNWGFVPLSSDEVNFMAKAMKRVARPELTVFIERAGVAVAVGMALPDFNVCFRRMEGRLFPLGWAQFLAMSRTLDAAVGQFIATTPSLQGQGIMRIVLAELVRKLQRAGFRTLEATWISETNTKSRASVQAMGMRAKHQLAVYERALQLK